MQRISFSMQRISFSKGRLVLEDFDGSSVGGTSSVTGEKRKGLSMWLTAVFVAGEMAGSGLLALPHAIAQSGWSGIALLFICCFNALFSGICLGRCWLILEERWEEYRAKSRNPYPTIASRAVAPWMRHVVSFCVDFTLFGVATVFLLLSAQVIGGLAKDAGVPSCQWILILGAVLCPLMWFGTPEDFWPAAIFALVTTVSAAILILVAMAKDYAVVEDRQYSPPDLMSYALSFATILFAFGGAATFPTFQNDMENKEKFPRSASLAFVVLMLMYVPVAVSGYFVYGSDVEDNVLTSILPGKGTLMTAIQVLLALHLFFAFLLAINAPAQEVEEFLRIPKGFGWKRCVVRSFMMSGVIFVAMSIPRFGKVLALVGASTVAMMTFVFPPLFYMLLVRQQGPYWPQRSIPMYQKVYLCAIMVIGIVGGAISTYAAIKDIVQGSAFTPPCYINMTAADSSLPRPGNNTHFLFADPGS